jgi:protein SCO1/2
MKNLFIVLLCSLVVSCRPAEKSLETEEDRSEMSIFQLPTEWQTQEGKSVNFSDYEGNVLVVVMIYTSCKVACPRLVADMKNLEQATGGNTKTAIKYLLVSIDPETDTSERLKAFAQENGMVGDQWVFLRGSEENTREFANVLSVRYAAISPIDFSHSNIISVFDKEGVMQHQMEGLAVNNEETLAMIRKYAAL